MLVGSVGLAGALATLLLDARGARRRSRPARLGLGAAGPGRRVRFLHVPNPAWRADGRVLDPAHPETLVYWTGPATSSPSSAS